MTPIKTISVPTKGDGNLFQIKTNGFTISVNNPQQSYPFYWEVYGSEEVDGVMTPTQCVMNGNLYMDYKTYAQWGDNDEFVIQWACDQLQFEII